MKITKASGIFALKLYLAAMLAFYIAAYTGLAQPYWAIVTCCVLMNPFYGATRAKAVYRLVGTISAGVTAITLATLFASDQILMLIFSGLFASLAAGCALIDRTPRSYICQLYAITLMLIIIPYIGSPLSMFTFTLTRLCEICLGIACCTIVDGLFVPGSLHARISGQVLGWVNDMQLWLEDLLDPNSSTQDRSFERVRVISDIANLTVLTDQIRYDPKFNRLDKQLIFYLQHKFLDVLKGFHILEQGRKTILAQQDKELTIGQQILQSNYTDVANKVGTDIQELKSLSASIRVSDNISDALKSAIKKAKPFSLSSDLAVAGEVTLACLLTFTVLSAFWYYTAWQQGPIILLLGVIPIVFFGGFDFADMAIEKFNFFVLFAMVIGGGFCYLLMPIAFNLGWFLFLCALILLPLGVWAFSNPMAILLLAFIFSNINLQNTYSPYAINTYIEQTVGCLVGVAIGYASLKLVRKLGAAHGLARALKNFQIEVNHQLAALWKNPNKANLTHLVDGLTHITPRLVATQKQELSEQLLSSISQIEQMQSMLELAEGASDEIQQITKELCQALSQQAIRPSDDLMRLIDQKASHIYHLPTTEVSKQLLVRILNLRLCLYPATSSWEPV